MVDEGDAPVDETPSWAPPRPPSYTSAWSPRTSSGVPRAQDQREHLTPAPPAAPPAAVGVRWEAERRDRRPRVLSRLSVTRRILLAYGCLAAAILLVVTVGGALQPTYGALQPWRGLHVDDVRSAPNQSSWAVDLAAIISPGTPPECLRFSTLDVGADLVAIRADGAWAYGFAPESSCSVVPAGFGSRVAVVDTRDGDVRWVHDVTDDFIVSQGASVTDMTSLDDGSHLLVHAETANQQVVENLSLATGQVLDTTGELPWSQDDRYTASGRVVALGALSSDSLEYTYELRNADDLSRIVWSGHGNESATMIALSDRLLLGGRGTLQIPLATGVATDWGGPVSTTSGYAVHDDDVFAANVSGSGVTTRMTRGFTALDRTGQVLWKSDLDLRGSYSTTRSCLAVTNEAGDTITCLDYRTGKPLWTTDVGSYSFAGSAPGQRTDDVYTVTTGSQAQLVAVDGATGRIRFETDVPAGSTVVAASDTVAYVAASGFTGARSTVIAVDASSGHTLWTRSSQVQVGVWGGHLVDVGMDGLARRLGS
ncbi:PQQ-binding-like beta-propeller repeat protein [Frondihabitans australicus]|uniref:Putative pyrroloquinoline-quinone binding quinoprotein n=1 Tax=Frondihabitans australicus TaxID=386892 RepID=A0A495ICJ0_9MICO|nr:PQQ-binding-like beta-propeller repeat protein [Frondihabitans australicus]RKR73639.1 putative pyrroloquinoline-quinone binding quinoprotein [Frondihabitans australicus]